MLLLSFFQSFVADERVEALRIRRSGHGFERWSGHERWHHQHLEWPTQRAPFSETIVATLVQRCTQLNATRICVYQIYLGRGACRLSGFSTSWLQVTSPCAETTVHWAQPGKYPSTSLCPQGWRVQRSAPDSHACRPHLAGPEGGT